MSYYHILIEMNDHISTIEQTREIEIFDILEIQPYLHSILLPFLNEQLIELEDENLTKSYILAIKSGAVFDARCFNIPKEEVTNCILWRQQDATRNSIQSVGQAYFSHKQLEGLNTNQIQELLFQEKGINWNDYPTKFRRGSCCIKKYHQTMNQTLRGYWYIDDEIPIFTGEGRDYIEKLI